MCRPRGIMPGYTELSSHSCIDQLSPPNSVQSSGATFDPSPQAVLMVH